MPNGEQPVTAEANSSDAHENETDFIITTDSPNDVNDAEHSQNERMKSGVSNSNEASEAARNENSDWPNSAAYHRNQEKSLLNLSERQENDANVSEKNSTNQNDAQNSPKTGDDIIVSEKSQNYDRNECLGPRGGKYNLRPSPI